MSFKTQKPQLSLPDEVDVIGRMREQVKLDRETKRQRAMTTDLSGLRKDTSAGPSSSSSSRDVPAGSKVLSSSASTAALKSTNETYIKSMGLSRAGSGGGGGGESSSTIPGSSDVDSDERDRAKTLVNTVVDRL